MRCIATFDVTTMAVLFERECRKVGIPAKIIPMPRSLSASCGLACEFPCEEDNGVAELCRARHVEVASFHRIEGDEM